LVSLTIELEEEKSEKLRRLAASKGWSVAELLRSGVDLLLRSGDSLTQSKAVGAGLKLSKKESSLLLGINRGLPPDAAERYRELVIRRREKRLSPTEHQELIRLSDEVESLQACRLESLGELARLRGATLRSVMDELGIAPAADA
jgi:hypothetical protein